MVPTNLVDQLRRDEGVRYVAYKDSLGNWSTATGHLILPTEQWMLTATLTDAQVNSILSHDIAVNCAPLVQFAWYNALDPIRQAACQNMSFNMGVSGLLHFPHMIAALARSDWGGASNEMLNSLWATQVKDRATRLAQQILTGAWQ